ncbi:hypothetical protein DL93DRAFT_2076309 [Clavulina sp. PMI_390]|nr:hypothetical protein DL93DRAFT_2076309 [Clavulina sp. PMI_390]
MDSYYRFGPIMGTRRFDYTPTTSVKPLIHSQRTITANPVAKTTSWAQYFFGNPQVQPSPLSANAATEAPIVSPNGITPAISTIAVMNLELTMEEVKYPELPLAGTLTSSRPVAERSNSAFSEDSIYTDNSSLSSSHSSTSSCTSVDSEDDDEGISRYTVAEKDKVREYPAFSFDFEVEDDDDDEDSDDEDDEIDCDIQAAMIFTSNPESWNALAGRDLSLPDGIRYVYEWQRGMHRHSFPALASLTPKLAQDSGAIDSVIDPLKQTLASTIGHLFLQELKHALTWQNYIDWSYIAFF